MSPKEIQERLTIRDYRTLARKFIEAHDFPEDWYARAIFAYLDKLSEAGANVLADSLAILPLLPDKGFGSGVILNYTLGVKQNRYTSKWMETEKCSVALKPHELEQLK